MKTKVKKCSVRGLSLLLCLAFLCLFPLQISAAEDPGNIGTYGTGKPSETWNWNDGTYYFHGDAGMSDLYSNYYFTGASRVEIHVENNRDTSLKVKLLKQQIGVDFAVSEETIPPNQYKTWSVELDSDRVYMLKFYAPCLFSGYISKI